MTNGERFKKEFIDYINQTSYEEFYQILPESFWKKFCSICPMHGNPDDSVHDCTDHFVNWCKNKGGHCND